MLNAISTALSGLAASSKKLEAAASNVANLGTTGSLEKGGQAPYSALTTQQSTGPGGSVRAEFVPKNPGFVPAYDPDSPFANGEGLIGTPNVDLAEEAVNFSLAELSYKANLKTLETASRLAEETARLLDDEA